MRIRRSVAAFMLLAASALGALVVAGTANADDPEMTHNQIEMTHNGTDMTHN
ncbi:hypothetical protein SAMN05192558_11289 [Actinokineospora alba]|uniref:Uncharacterized protein n=1 Tax=Actinokineospora alba TaxID=504798 RepID=A0A1H0UV20_9PSEU|nr:hypothetical protein [Actinokineospora alba]TDP69039.1 hypothetical protein C8E96_4610 [Actinokineospora alba]SDI78120.1 hypothetical protein SAMN05421871_107315 [Actinokineospora alba]SDP70020.1 hypothetical protein SAMN05192558_11289 [Actinokineospora alba]